MRTNRPRHSLVTSMGYLFFEPFSMPLLDSQYIIINRGFYSLTNAYEQVPRNYETMPTNLFSNNADPFFIVHYCEIIKGSQMHDMNCIQG